MLYPPSIVKLLRLYEMFTPSPLWGFICRMKLNLEDLTFNSWLKSVGNKGEVSAFHSAKQYISQPLTHPRTHTYKLDGRPMCNFSFGTGRRSLCLGVSTRFFFIFWNQSNAGCWHVVLGARLVYVCVGCWPVTAKPSAQCPLYTVHNVQAPGLSTQTPKPKNALADVLTAWLGACWTFIKPFHLLTDW